MQRFFSFRQKLAGAFALLLSLILLNGAVACLALQEYGTFFGDLHAVDQIVEMTLRAHMNKEHYVLTGERHTAITVQEQLQEAHRMVKGILRDDSALGKSILYDMSTSLEKYMATFSQYVVYEDQQRALASEERRLAEDLLLDISDLRQTSGIITDKDYSRINRLLITSKKGLGVTTDKSISLEEAGQELRSLVKDLEEESSDTTIKMAIRPITSTSDNYLQVLRKIITLEELQRANEFKMAIAAEDVQTLGKAAVKNQQEQAKQGQLLTTNIMTLVFLLSAGVALWATFYLSNRLAKPLRDLGVITSSIGQGNFHERIEVGGDHEFHSLLININQMAENIADLNTNMEQLVEERTKALELEKIRFEKLFETSPEGILILDDNMQVLAANNAFTTIFGYTLSDILHRNIQDFLLLDNSATPSLLTTREESLRRCKDGTLRPVSIVKYSFQQFGGQNLYYGIYTDISERKEAEERLHFLSFHDSLTTLKNRTYFELEMARLENSQEACGIIVCDVDGLKYVNDNWGHGAGDQLLKDAAQLLTVAAKGRALARVGGDEFVILLPGAFEDETRNMVLTIDAQLAARENEQPHPLMISVGYAHRQKGNIHMEDLFSLADKMMYSIKKSRREHR